MTQHTLAKATRISIVLLVVLMCVVALAACKTDKTDVTYTVTFNVDGAVYNTLTIGEGASVTLPSAPTKEGYTFDGWYLDQGTWANAFSTSGVTADITVYAKWKENSTDPGTNPDDPKPDDPKPDDPKPDDPKPTETSSLNIELIGFAAEGDTFSCTVPNSQAVLSLGDVLRYDAKSSIVVSTDVQGENTLTGDVTFAEGNNTFYIKVTATDGNSKIYTVNVYRKHLYTVTFVTGTDATIDPVPVEEGRTVAAPTVTLTRDGYTFAGWDYNFEQAVGANVTVTAQWEAIVHTVSFVTGVAESVDPVPVQDGQTVAEPNVALSRVGYTFGGWDHDFSAAITADTTITALWTAKTYTVSFENEVHAPITVTYDEDMPAITYEYFKEGHLFDGLAYQGVKYYNADLTSAKAWDVDADDVVLTEIWVAGGYRVALNPDNGSNNGQATLVYGEDFTLAVPTKTGYMFDYWYALVGEDRVQMTDAEGNSLEPSAIKDNSWTFTAHWSPISITVTLDPNGGAVTPDSLTLGFDQNEYSLPVPVKDGCDFLGWYVGEVAYTNNVGVSVKTWDHAEDTTLVAKYDEVDYTITFDMNGGAPQQAALTANYHGAWPTVTTVPTKTGYVFNGYYTENEVLVYTVQEGEMVCNNNQFYFTHDTTLEARWTPISVTVFFDHNGGDSDMASKVVIYDQGMGNLAQSDLPTRDGYVFTGYFSAKEGGTKYYNADGTSANSGDLVADTTLYAQWKNGVYFVKFDKNAEGVFGVMADQEIELNVGTALSVANYNLTGYSFASWNTKADGTGTTYADNAEVLDLAPNGERIILYAQWTANTYTVTFSAANGTGEQASVTATYNEDMPTIEVAVSRTGYIFDGYYAGDVKYYNADGTSAKTWNIGSDVALTAWWTAKQWTVHFDANGGSEISQTTTATFNHDAPSFGAQPLRTGYNFLGWYTAAEGGVQYIDNYGNGNTKWEMDVEGEDATLYAHWQAQTFYVQFDANYGSGSMSAVTATYGEAMPNVAVYIYRTGYTLTGFYDASSGGTKYYNADGTGAHVWDKTNNWLYLYAQWTANTYTVNFDANGGTGEQASIQVTYNEYPEAIEITLSRTYYKFVGFFDEYNSQWYSMEGSAYYRWTKTADTTLYAHWQNGTYGITYHSNYGEDSTNTLSYNNNSSDSLRYGYSRTGYTFKEWNTKADGTGEGYEAYEAINNFADNGETIDLYAIYTANSYETRVHPYYGEWDVSFDLNYENPAIEAPATQHVTPATGLRFVVPAEREGYVFAGWYKEPECTNQFNFYSTVTADTTVYAKWVETESPLVLVEDGEYDITITADNQYFNFYCYQSGYVYFEVGKEAFVHVGSDHYGPTFSQYCYAGTLYECYYHQKTDAPEYRGDTTITISRAWPPEDGRAVANYYYDYFTYDADVPLGVLTAEGYIFGGWYSSTGGNGTQFVDAEGNAVTPFNYYYSNYDIYAYWIPNTYTITLNQNGGEGGLDSIEVAFGDYPVVAEEDLPTREDYDFAGYFSAAVGGSQFTYADGSGYNTWKTAAGGTLYAHWTLAPYRVKYDGNGADEGAMSDSIFSRNSERALSFYSFVKAGYTCSGWNTAADGSGTAYGRTATVQNLAPAHGEITLYAQWTPNAYKATPVTNKTASHTITFDLNGYDGEVPAPQEVTVAEGAKLPYVARDGYELVGWYDNAECTGSPYAVYDEQTEDVTLYAKWRTAEYSGSETLLSLGDAIEITFAGTENKNDLATGVYYAFIAPSDMKVCFYTESNIDTYGYLRAADKSAITYDDDGGQGNNFLINRMLTGGTLYYVMALPYSAGSTATVVLHVEAAEGEKHPMTKLEDVDVTYDAAFSIEVPTLIGHEFLGWYDGINGTGTQYTGADGESIVNWNKTANANLYAYWQVGTFAVSFDANDGTGTQATVEATFGESMPAITVAVSRANYTFLGYFDAAVGGTKYYNADGTSARTWDKSAATLYAHWQGLPYTVAFDKNGGEGAMSNQTLYYATAGNLTANAFTRAGYDFAGWNTASDGAGTDYADEAEVTDLTSVGETITLYAQWTAKEYEITLVKRSSYTVSFDCGGYCDNPADQVVTSSLALTYPMVFSDQAVVFTGWKLGDYYYNFGEELTEDITLTANWRATSYTRLMPFAVSDIDIPYGSPRYCEIGVPVTGTYTFTLSKPSHIGQAGAAQTQVYKAYLTAGSTHSFFVQAQFDDDEHKGAATMTITCTTALPTGGKATPATVESTTTVTYGAATTIAAHTSAGYTFMGWFDGENGTGTKYVNADGTSAKTWDKTAEDAVLYAYYVPNEYTVSFDMNGGTGSQESLTATFDAAMPTLTAALPTKATHTFLGYFSATTGGTKYYNADGTSATTYNLAAGTTLYAQWEKYYYYVAFDANGGEGEMEDQRITMDEATELTDYDFSRTGYTFAKWNTEADGSGTDYSNQESVTNIADAFGTITLYAQWAPIGYSVTRVYNVRTTYTITFNVNGADCDAPEAQTVGVAHGLALPQPVWAGHELVGWYDNAACTGDPISTSTAYLADMELFAKWRTAEYAGSDELLTVGGSYALTFDETVYRAEPGYWFAFVAPCNMRVKIYSTKVEGNVDTMGWLFPAGSKDVSDMLASNDDGNGDSQFAIEYNVTAGTIYYIGVGNYYGYEGVCNICIDAVEGTAWKEEMASTSATYDSAFDLGTPPAKAGYTFKGWYTQPEGEGTQLTDSTGASLAAWNIASATTVYAKWEED